MTLGSTCQPDNSCSHFLSLAILIGAWSAHLALSRSCTVLSQFTEHAGRGPNERKFPDFADLAGQLVLVILGPPSRAIDTGIKGLAFGVV